MSYVQGLKSQPFQSTLSVYLTAGLTAYDLEIFGQKPPHLGSSWVSTLSFSRIEARLRVACAM